jgi:hypothetical protein
MKHSDSKKPETPSPIQKKTIYLPISEHVSEIDVK